MNLKLNNDCQSSQRIIVKKPVSAIKEERRRTGRYIAILVGISLFLLAMYHAWVRRIPIVASLVVPALIMFIYVAWVLYTASKDKHRLLDAEAALQAAALESENEAQYSEQIQNNMDTLVNRDSKLNSPERSIHKNCTETYVEGRNKADTDSRFLTPLILINDELPEGFDQKWSHVVQVLTSSGKLKGFSVRRRHKRKFCRRKHAVFKRSYSIA